MKKRLIVIITIMLSMLMPISTTMALSSVDAKEKIDITRLCSWNCFILQAKCNLMN